jgi:membrane protease YdiL (CAAX protease family)
MQRRTPLTFPLDIALIACVFVLVSLALYEALHFQLGSTTQVIVLSDSAVLIVGLAVPAILGVGLSSWEFVYLVAAFCFTEEILISSFLYPYGLALAFAGLVGFPALGVVVGGENKFLQSALEVSGLLFITRIALIPFPIAVLTLPISLPAIYTLILVAIIFYLIMRKVPLKTIRFARGKLVPVQVAMASLGLPLGFVEYEILKPTPLAFGPTPLTNEIYLAVTMVFFVGLTEEILFRGLLLGYLNHLMPQWLAVHLSSLIFALFHIGYYSPTEILFAYAAGVLLSYLVIKTDSLTPAILAHGVGGVVLFTLAMIL